MKKEQRENPDGTAKDVVDLGDVHSVNKIQSLETSDVNAVERAEFAADSFLTYVVVWQTQSQGEDVPVPQSVTLYVHHVDEKGNKIAEIETIEQTLTTQWTALPTYKAGEDTDTRVYINASVCAGGTLAVCC